MASAETLKEEREWLEKLRQRRDSSDARLNALKSAGPLPSADLRSFVGFADRLLSELSGFAAPAARLRAAGLPAFESKLAAYRDDLAKIKEIFEKLLKDRHETETKVTSILHSSAGEAVTTMQEIHRRQQKIFEDGNEAFNKYLKD